METILTGIRTNSDMTLGNVLGALIPMTRLANKHSVDHHVNIFVPDLHTIIADIDGNLQSNILRSIRYYLAAGLEINDNIHIYRQSYIPAHSELTWILNCIATMGEMNRMTQWKDKSGDKNESVNAGIFNYPVLMSADILLYSAKYIPVGEDQFQHLELTRNLAERFNHRYGDTFTVPATTKEQAKFMGVDDGIRIRSLTDPKKKMSKSDPAETSKIMMTDTPEQAHKKIMSATTDSVGVIQYDMFNQPGISNLLQILALITDKSLQEVVGEWSGKTTYGDLKQAVASAVAAFLADFQSRLAAIPDEYIYDIFSAGEKYATPIADATLLRAQKAIGLR